MSKEVDFKSLVQPVTKSTGEPVTKEFKCFSVKQVDLEKRQIRVLASNADLDRDEERILPEAFKARLSIYLQNPVVMVGHQHRLDGGQPSVVGRAVSVWVDKEGLWAVIEFAKTELAETFWELYSQGYMKAVSIGFIGIAWHNESVDGKNIRTYDEVELLEISLVAVPSNRAALAKSRQRKADFVAGKQEGRQEEQLIAEMRASGELTDDMADEFAKAILFDDYGTDNEDAARKATTGIDFAGIISGKESKPENDFAALVSGR
jgi:HK97 family phage prohead protease